MPLLRRHCPKCGTKVGWARLWLKPWLGARWPCRGCGATLMFDVGRRTLVAILLAFVFAVVLGVGKLLGPQLGSLSWLPIALATPPMILILLLDAVTLA